MRTDFFPIKYYDEWGSAGSGALTGVAAGASFGPIGALAGGVIGGAAGLISGLSQKKKAAKLLANNKYPGYVIPNEILQNQQIAKQMANEGLPSQQYQDAMKNIQRQQTAALRGAQDRRAGVGLIGQIQQGTNDATARLDAANAAARQQNQRALLGVNSQVAGYRDKAFDWNQKNLYNQQYNYGMGLQGAGNQNIMGGIDALSSGLLLSGLGSRGGGLFGGSNRFGRLNPTGSNGAGTRLFSNNGEPIVY